MGFVLIPEKGAAGWPLLPDYGHYIGRKSGLFCQTGHDNCPDLFREESNGFTGLF
jgi:hypothetical protein